MTLIDPLHTWTVGDAQVMIAEAPEDAALEHKRSKAPLLFLTELWVPPHARRAGHGHALMLAATEWADSACVDLWLYTSPHGAEPRPDHRALAAFYKQYKFKRVSRYSPDYEMVRRYVRA